MAGKSKYESVTAGTPLKPRQLAFCREYLIDLNAKQAAIRAGYRGGNTAKRQGSVLAGLPNVRAEVGRLMEERAKRTEVTADMVLRELVVIALFDPAGAMGEDGSVLPLGEMPEEIRRAISALDVRELWKGKGAERVATGHAKRLRFWDKLKALELLGKHLGLFTERVELTGKEGGPVEVGMTQKQSDEFDAYLATLREGLRAPGGGEANHSSLMF